MILDGDSRTPPPRRLDRGARGADPVGRLADAAFGVERDETLLQQAVSWLVYPLTLVAALWIGHQALRRGFGEAGVVLALSVSVIALVVVLEHVHPHAREWSRPRGDVRTDILHMLFSQLVSLEAFDVLIRGLLLAGAASLAELLGHGLWPSALPLPLQVALALLLAELCHYWWHRWTHAVHLLWRFHATHHSSERLYWLASVRFHPLDNVVAYGLQVAPLLLLGCGGEVLALFTLFVSVHGLFQHGNVRVRCGWLNYVLSTPELHRWHHARAIEDSDSNYGGYLIVWDLVFRTWHLPRDRRQRVDDLGLHAMPRFPKRYLGQLLSPFRWARLTGAGTPGGEPTTGSRSSWDGSRRPGS